MRSPRLEPHAIALRAGLLILISVAIVVLAADATTASPHLARGAGGLGDPFFPKAGNPGYDVSRYDLDLSYRPNRERLDARTTIKARASAHLSTFHLDYRGPESVRWRWTGHRLLTAVVGRSW